MQPSTSASNTGSSNSGDFPVLVERDRNGQTSLHHAAKKGDSITVRALLSDPALNVPDNFGHTPLFHAMAGNHVDAAFLLSRWNVPQSVVKEHVDNNTDDYKARALYTAISQKNKDMVGFLLEIGASPTARGYGCWPNYYATPLHEAAYFGPDEIIQMLLNQGASKWAKDAYGNYPSSSSWMLFGQSLLAI